MLGDILAAAIASPILDRVFAFVFALALLWILHDQLGRVVSAVDRLVSLVESEGRLADRRERAAIARESEMRQRIIDVSAQLRQEGHTP